MFTSAELDPVPDTAQPRRWEQTARAETIEVAP